MLNKNAKWLLWGSLALCCGCVDNAYDLNKDIVMDVTIAGNKITLPSNCFIEYGLSERSMKALEMISR